MTKTAFDGAPKAADWMQLQPSIRNPYFGLEMLQALKKLDWGNMTYQMTGEYENQRRFVKTMQLVFPSVLLIIFVTLYMVYHSALEAAHVMLAVPFALSGGVFLQKILGYNFNGAVWVGYIALFGTAVQTGVVMVVYLEEMVKKRVAERGSAFNYADLVQAVKDGARLRLRPKVMTVATIVASLLPIMWKVMDHDIGTLRGQLATAGFSQPRYSLVTRRRASAGCSSSHEQSRHPCLLHT